MLVMPTGQKKIGTGSEETKNLWRYVHHQFLLFQRRRRSNEAILPKNEPPRSLKPHWSIAGAFSFGIIFIISLLVLAIYFPNPTTYQYEVFKVILALAAAGITSVIPGFIRVNVPGIARAGGAIGVFAIVYFFTPAQLMIEEIIGRDYMAADYLIEESIWIIDLSTRESIPEDQRATANSRVIVERRDKFIKTTDERKDFILYFGTSGKLSLGKSIQAPAPCSFNELDPDDPFSKPLKKSYNYILNVGGEPSGYKGTIHNRYVYYNAFQGEQEEWWASDIKYPTRKAFVSFIFPDDKTCQSILTQLKHAEENPIELSENPAIITEGGKTAFWSGYNLHGAIKIIFKFEW